MADELAYGYVPIEKWQTTDDGTLLVSGPASDSGIDSDEQIADPDWLDRELPAWFKTGGNIREQHDARRAAGVALTLDKREDGVHWITAEVVDPVSAAKVQKGVLRGFSFGARGGRIVRDKAARGGRIVDGRIVEVSLVDRPANPRCLFTVAKAEGATGDLRPVESPELLEKSEDEQRFTPSQFAELLKSLGKTPVEKRDFSDKERQAAADAGEAMPDGSYPIKSKQDLKNAIQAFGRAKNPAATKRHIIARARALDAVDMLPDDWHVAKAMDIAARVRALVPGAIVKADDAAFDPATEASDVDDAQSAIAVIARLIISEAEGLAAGRAEELCDIQLLVSAAEALQCFAGRETDQEAQLAMTTTKTETGSLPVSETTKTDAGQPAGVIEKAENEHDSTTDTTDTIADLTKAMDAQRAELTALRADLAEVMSRTISGGPVRTRTTGQSRTAAAADKLRSEVTHLRKMAESTTGSLQEGYAIRLEKVEAELAALVAG